MPQDNNYETRLEELRTREAEIREKLRQLPEKIMNNRNEIANLYGVNVTEVDLGNNEERQKLQEELAEILKEQGEVFEARRQEKIAEDKLKREERKEKNKRNAKLQQAYEFFTYLDTTTTKGYNLDGLTEEEILNLYDDFMTKPEYEQIKEEILEKIKKNDREIVIPKLAQSEKSEEKSLETRLEELRTREAEIREKLRQLPEKIMNNRNEIANLYGVNVTEVDLGNNEERQKLQEELAEILKEQSEIFEANRKEKIAEDKLKREERKEKNKRNAKLQQAYEFFTYLDTTTTKGYNLDGLTEEEILNLYDDFMTKPEYEQIKEETLEKIKKNDREVIIPSVAQTKATIEEKKENQTVPKFSEETVNKLKDMIDPSSLAAMMKKPEEQKEEKAIVKYDGVEDTPLDAIPDDVINTEIEEPKPSLFKRAKEWINNNKKKVALIAASAALALGIGVGVAVYDMANNEASATQETAQLDVSALSNQIAEGIEAEQARQNANVAPSTLDFANQQFDPSILSGEGKDVFTNANDAMNNNNEVVTNEWYQIDNANLIGPDNKLIDTSNMTNEEVQKLLKTGEYSVATTHDGVGMGFENAENVLDKMQEAQGGRSL